MKRLIREELIKHFLFTVTESDGKDILRTVLHEKNWCQMWKWQIVDKEGLTALHCAVLHDRPNIVSMLLEYGPDVWAKYKNKTPLKLALEKKSKECALLFLEHMQSLKDYPQEVARIKDLIQ